MKLVNLSLYVSLALALTISAVGCGKSPDTTQTSNPGIVTTAGVTPLPGIAGVPAGALPLGSYYPNGAQCPQGYSSNGQYCQATGGSVGYGCGQGYFYNGYSCQQIGYYYNTSGCPYGTTWSNYYYGCVGYGNTATNCKTKSYLSGLINTYVCY